MENHIKELTFYKQRVKMEPVAFGKKRALLVKTFQNNLRQNGKNRREEVIEKLREFPSVKLWENGENKMSLEKLTQNPYLLRPVPEKRNKNGSLSCCPNYFFLLTTIQDKRICCFIEKKKPLEKSNIYQTRFRFKDNMFNGTLFTGSLVISDETRPVEREEVTDFFSQVFTSIKREVSAPVKKNNWLFILSDIWGFPGDNLSSLLCQRLSKLQDIMGRDWFPDPKLDVCDFEVSAYKNYSSISDFLKDDRQYFTYTLSDNKVVAVPSQSAPGFEEYSFSLRNKILDPRNNGIAKFKKDGWKVEQIKDQKSQNICKQIIKHKDREMFLKMSEYPDVYWVHETNNWKKIGVALVRTINESRKLKQLFEENEENGRDYIKLKCEWCKDFEKWKPVF